MKEKHKIGELLLNLKILEQKNLDIALEEQKRTGARLGAILLKMNLIQEEDLEHILSKQLHVPSINLDNYTPSQDLFTLMPEKIIMKYMVLPISVEGRTLTVATANPRDLTILDDLSRVTGYRIVPVVTSISALKRKIQEIFEKPVQWQDALKIDEQGDLEIISPEKGLMEEDLEKAFKQAEETLVVKLVNAIILEAIDKEATHIHIEPKEDSFDVFLRVNGRLRLLIKPPQTLQQNVLNRVKILSSIDIINRMIPHEGYFRAKSLGRLFDIDVATLPSMYGERMVLTFQQPFSKEDLKLEKLGFAPDTLSSFKELLQKPRGLILVTGQTDSGKSSTIYAALNHLKNPDKSIFTYERNIKNKLSGINQGQPNEKAGYSYEKGLKALTRQDMDILMVGEMLTKDAIISTLLTSLSKTLVLGRFLSNNSIGAISMILDMDVPPFMLYSALTAILGQRLVRRLCQECITDYEPPREIADEIQLLTGKKHPKLFRSKGCMACGHSGYINRIGLFELVIPSMELRDAIFARAPLSELKEAAARIGYRTFRQDGIIKAAEGLTSFEELVRVI